jgi:hypothetical protein
VRQLTGVIAGLAVAISVWGCLPFSRSYIASPPIVGVYHAETGEPLGGVQLAISTVSGDSLCASPAVQTTTDSAGAFSFPGTEGHDAVIILAPGDRELSYAFCARVAGIMRFVFKASSGVNRSFGTRPDSLTCIESRTPNTAPVACTKQQ